MQSFYFYANPFQEKSVEAAGALCDRVKAGGAEVYTEDWLAKRGVGAPCELSAIPEGVNALVVFGGDGTLLRAAQAVIGKNIPLFGVHTGTVGFLMPGRADAPEETAALLLNGAYTVRFCPLLHILHEGKTYFALNDLALTRGEHPGVIEVNALADREIVFSAHGDGAVVSTPLGATAYGLSAGGPIVRPDAPCLLLTPLCARELTLRPVILPLTAHITLRAHGRERRRLQLAVDGQTLLPVTTECAVDIRMAEEKILLISPQEARFFDTLRAKQTAWNRQDIIQE